MARESNWLWLASRYRGDAGGADEGGDEEAERDQGEAPTDNNVTYMCTGVPRCIRTLLIRMIKLYCATNDNQPKQTYTSHIRVTRKSHFRDTHPTKKARSRKGSVCVKNRNCTIRPKSQKKIATAAYKRICAHVGRA